MFGDSFKFDFKNSEYVDWKCKNCGEKTTHVVRTDYLECMKCGIRNG